MHLTKEEENILNGEQGEIKAKAMRILSTLGEIFKADGLIPIESAQIAGISYKTIGDAGVEFLEEWASHGVKVKVESRMNPAGMDLENWKRMGISEEFARKQFKIIEALTAMGIKKSCTCTPYLAGLKPKFGSHIAWSESSAVIFANSVLGARTNREGGPSALSAALIGKTPNYGLHLDKNRRAELVFELNFGLSDFNYSLLGYHIGEIAKNRIPLIKGIKRANWDQLKILGAGAAASGGVPMFMIPNITPENRVIENPEIIHVDESELMEVKNRFSTDLESSIIAFGCPHCSKEEVQDIINKINTQKEIWIFTTNQIKHQFKNLPKNVKIFSDTCMVVCPIEDMGVKCVSTNSSKCAHYSLNLSRIKANLKSKEELLNAD